MRKTYAYNSVIIGILVGILVYVSSESLALGLLALLGVSVLGFIVIRVIENLISKGVDKAADAAERAYRKHREQKEEQK